MPDSEKQTQTGPQSSTQSQAKPAQSAQSASTFTEANPEIEEVSREALKSAKTTEPAAPPQPVIPGVSDIDDDFGSTKAESPLDEMLTELNLTRKHLYGACGCIVGLGLIIVAAFYGYRLFFSDSTESETSGETGEETVIETDDQSLVSGIEAGKPEKLLDKEQSGLAGTILFGEEAAGLSNAFRQYLIVLKRMQNAYGTDVQALLDQAVNRRGVLGNHLTSLRFLLKEGQTHHEALQIELEGLKAPFETIAQNRLAAEEAFFAAVDSLDAFASEEQLKIFIENSREAVNLRARFSGLEKIASFYDQALPRLEARIKDIELNEEALVKGIKVFDVKGSDLQLIVQ